MTPSIVDLLGLPQDVAADRLRHAYEGAVAAATARGDWARAGQLSTAFDALPRQVRLAVYSGRDRDAPRWEPIPARRRRLPGSRPERSSRPRRRSLQRIVLAGLSAILALLSVATWLIHRPSPAPPYTAVARPPALSTRAMANRTPTVQRGKPHHSSGLPRLLAKGAWKPMRALYPGAGEVVVPVDAVTDQRGRAYVMCPAARGSSWHLAKPIPGQHFACPSGDVGLVRVRTK